MNCTKELSELATARGIKLTPSRQAIINTIALLPDPFSASQLLNAVATSSSPVGRATVFRTLQLLCNHHVLERIRLHNGQDAYVKGHPVEHHHHLICNACGAITNLYDKNVGELAQQLAQKHNYHADEHVFEIYGICSTCLHNKRLQPPS
jgi:Fur family ferric uptake transcriptional regulator